jgi:hypothetical protein
MPLAGSVHVDWPGVCKRFNWDPAKVCGPTTMAAVDPAHREENCCYGHAAGCDKHKQPMAKGKLFVLVDHKAELVKAGLTTFHDELRSGKKPPGTPKTVGDVVIYPARHFA